MQNRLITKNKKEKGQSLVELALSLTFLLLLLAGIADLGRAFLTFISLRDAAQEGALYGSTDPLNTDEIINRVCGASNSLKQLCAEGDISIDINLPGTACLNYPIQVLVTYEEFPIVMPFSSVFLGDEGISLQASATDTILRPACP